MKSQAIVAYGAPLEEVTSPIPTPTEFSPRVLNTDDLDVPAFLRNRSNSQR